MLIFVFYCKDKIDDLPFLRAAPEYYPIFSKIKAMKSKKPAYDLERTPVFIPCKRKIMGEEG